MVCSMPSLHSPPFVAQAVWLPLFIAARCCCFPLVGGSALLPTEGSSKQSSRKEQRRHKQSAPLAFHTKFPSSAHLFTQRSRQRRTAMDNSTQASTNYREAFQLFDKRGNGKVDRAALGDLLRACGQNPTLAEIADLERGVGADCAFVFSLSPFFHSASHSVLCVAEEYVIHNADVRMQSTSRPSPRSSTGPVASASPSTLRNTSAASRSSTRTARDSSERARSSTF